MLLAALLGSTALHAIVVPLFGVVATRHGGASVRSFSISPAVSGKSVWNLDIDGPLNLGTSGTWAIVPTSTFTLTQKSWGAGGQSNVGLSLGAAAGFAGGLVVLLSGLTYTLTVGSVGTTGGGATNSLGIKSGGFSGITQGVADILIAPGGGGGGYGGDAGAGGGTTGQAGTNFDPATPGCQGLGGTPSAGGAGGNGLGGAGSARQGGNGGTSGGPFPGGPGGGGHYGGGGGGYNGGGGAGGGGGGSGYADPGSVTSAVLTAGNRTTPGNSGDGSRGGSGDVNTDGRLLIS